MIDPKGEWVPLAHALGWTGLQLCPGGTVRVNPLDPGPRALADELDTSVDGLRERRRLLLDACSMLVEHDLRGMCDGATTVELNWAVTPGLVLDLSALLANRKALRLVLTAVVGWLAAVMYSRPDRHKLNIIDEGWAALDDLAIVRYLQDQWRLGRQWGCGNILITHAIGDLRSQADDGAAQNKIAEGLLNTTACVSSFTRTPNRSDGSWPIWALLRET